MAVEIIVPQRKLRGVSYTSTDTPKRIEDALEMDYPNPPGLLNMNWRNRRIVAANDFFYPDDKLIPSFKSDPKNLRAYFENLYRTIFRIAPDLTAFEELHEFGHGLQANINPLTDKRLDEDWRAAKDFSGEGRYKKLGVEEGTVIRVFEEGMANWIAGCTAENAGTEESWAQLANWRRNAPVSTLEQINNRDYDQAIIDQLQKMQLAIHLEQKAEKELSRAKRRELRKHASSNLDEIKYPLGYWFADAAMKSLIDEGMPPAQALIRIVQNPPQTLEEFLAPDPYSQRLTV